MQSAVASPVPKQDVLVIRPPQPWRGGWLREVWSYRELLYFLVWRDLKVRYKQTILGVAWALLQPLMYMIVFSLFFGRLAKLPTGGIPYPIFSIAALLPWLFFSNAVTLAAPNLVGNSSLLTKIYFPRLLLAIAPVLVALVDFGLSFLVLAGTMGYYAFAPPWWHLAFLPLFVGVAVAAALGAGMLFAAVSVKYRDVRYVIPFLMQVWLFATPVVYWSRFLSEPWRTIYHLNPMVGAVDGFRWMLYGGLHDSPGQFALSGCSALVFLAVGLVYFRRTERNFADIV